MEQKRRVRVCHVITELECGGAQDNTLTTVETLPQDRYETFLISGPGGMLDDRARRTMGTRLFFVPTLVRPVCPVRDTLAFLSLIRLFRAGRYDIVHTHSSKAGILGRLAARVAGIPRIIHTAHGWGFHDRQSPPIRAIFIACERLAARWTDTIVAVSKATVEKGLAAHIGLADRYAVIHSGIDPTPFRVSADVPALRRNIGLDPDKPVVMMVACLKPQKSPLDFLAVADRVRRDVAGVQFALAGDGELRPQMEREIERMKLQSTVHLLGWRTDIADLLRASDLLLHTSLWEGLPRVFLESIAAGLPIIATNVDGAPEAVQDGVNGYLFQPGDTDGMAGRICDLLRSRDRVSALRARAAASWRDEFDIRDMVQTIDRLYVSMQDYPIRDR